MFFHYVHSCLYVMHQWIVAINEYSTHIFEKRSASTSHVNSQWKNSFLFELVCPFIKMLRVGWRRIVSNTMQECIADVLFCSSMPNKTVALRQRNMQSNLWTDKNHTWKAMVRSVFILCKTIYIGMHWASSWLPTGSIFSIPWTSNVTS